MMILSALQGVPSVPLRTASRASSSATHCMRLVKSRDHERYLATLLLPQPVRQSAFALRAFNSEISHVQDSVSEKTIGMMRMQFWKDSVKAMYNTSDSKKSVPEHPVAQELYAAIQKHSLSKVTNSISQVFLIGHWNKISCINCCPFDILGSAPALDLQPGAFSHGGETIRES